MAKKLGKADQNHLAALEIVNSSMWKKIDLTQISGLYGDPWSIYSKITK